MLDPSTIALVMAPRLVAQQFAEPARTKGHPRRTESPSNPARALAARALRAIADSLEPSPEERTAS